MISLVDEIASEYARRVAAAEPLTEVERLRALAIEHVNESDDPAELRAVIGVMAVFDRGRRC